MAETDKGLLNLENINETGVEDLLKLTIFLEDTPIMVSDGYKETSSVHTAVNHSQTSLS
jgi:predicted transcriptional regulator